MFVEDLNSPAEASPQLIDISQVKSMISEMMSQMWTTQCASSSQCPLLYGEPRRSERMHKTSISDTQPIDFKQVQLVAPKLIQFGLTI